MERTKYCNFLIKSYSVGGLINQSIKQAVYSSQRTKNLVRNNS